MKSLTIPIRDRVVELRRLKASTLIPHSQNWRIHTEEQQAVLAHMLGTIGYAGALIGRDTPQGVQILDGHLRSDTTPDATVPVLIVDLNDEEAKMLLATHDPITAMAKQDDAMLQKLLQETSLAENTLFQWAKDYQETSEPTPLTEGEVFPGMPPQEEPIKGVPKDPDPYAMDEDEKPENDPLRGPEPPQHTCPRCLFTF